jgi:myo-inositol-1(or 4)-monophosphatase
MKMHTIDDYLRVCEQAVRVGSREIHKWVGRFEVRKKGYADLVTQADFASQEAVRQTVLGAFAEHSFLGEENLAVMKTGTELTQGDSPIFADTKIGTVPSNLSQQRAEYRWIVDPLDGTTNFVHGVPHYCVSLALERNGELLAGAVYDPMLDECFTAAKGQGAKLNGQAIHASAVTDLSEALAAVGFPPDVGPDTPDLRVFLKMIGRCQAIRRTGSSALNLCYLAAGRYDVYWSYSTKIWDVAAGALIVREAGGRITSTDGSEFCLEEASFLAAANDRLHVQLREIAATTNDP